MLTANNAAEFDEGSGIIGPRRQVSDEDLDRYVQAAARRYREAFRGPPWFERSRCLSGCPAAAEFCDSEPGTQCDIAGRPTSDEAHPVTRTTEDLRRLLDEHQALIVVEHDGIPQGDLTARFGAVFWVSTAQDLWSARYALVPAMKQWLIEEFGGRTFLYRDEVFGDLERPGNLRYYHKLCEAAAADLGQTLLVGRTINAAVMHVLARRFPSAVRVLAPADAKVRRQVGVPVRCCPYVQAVVPDDRYIVVIDLMKAEAGTAMA